jgi:hypothetical protein
MSPKLVITLVKFFKTSSLGEDVLVGMIDELNKNVVVVFGVAVVVEIIVVVVVVFIAVVIVVLNIVSNRLLLDVDILG